MPSIEFDVWCATCGAGLCSTVVVDRDEVRVPVCEQCKDDAYDKGRDEGYEEGLVDGAENCS